MKPKCIDHATCPGSEPFYVGHFSQVTTEKHGYAPAYCSYCMDYVPEGGVKGRLTTPQSPRTINGTSVAPPNLLSIENRRDIQEHFKLHHTLEENVSSKDFY